MRKKFIAGNWKMFTDSITAEVLAAAVVKGLGGDTRVTVAVCPPFPYLSRVFQTVKGTPVALSKGEYALLLAFLEAPQRPLSREQLLQSTRMHEDIFDRSIDVQVSRLRRKLEVDPSAPRVIQTERGIGYVFALPVEPF